MIFKALIVLSLLFTSPALIRAELHDTYLPAAKASLSDKKTLIVVIGAEEW